MTGFGRLWLRHRRRQPRSEVNRQTSLPLRLLLDRLFHRPDEVRRLLRAGEFLGLLFGRTPFVILKHRHALQALIEDAPECFHADFLRALGAALPLGRLFLDGRSLFGCAFGLTLGGFDFS